MSEERRQKRRKSSAPRESECPVCGVTLRAGKVDAHLQLEMMKLMRLPQSRPLSQRTPIVSVTSLNALSSEAIPSTSSSHTGEICSTSRLKEKFIKKGADWQNYDKIRRSRQARENRRRGNSANEALEDGGVGQRECPVCDKPFASEQIERHITRCLRQAETEFEDDEVDVEGDEYEWCGVTRIRATTLLAEEQLHAIGTKVKRGSEDEMVDVCDDDVEAFGPSQYTDQDLSRLDENGQASYVDSDSHDHSNSQENLTRNQESSNQLSLTPSTYCTDGSEPQPSEISATGDGDESLSSIVGGSNAPSWSSPNHGISSDRDSPVLKNKNMIVGIGTEDSSSSPVWPKDSDGKCEDDIQRENPKECFGGDKGNDSIKICSQGGAAVGVGGGGAAMEALRARVRDLEEERMKGRYACRVCHGDYDKPVVSISCWHVHCETCWLHALAAKKLCPQCSGITSTSDLRRVYF